MLQSILTLIVSTLFASVTFAGSNPVRGLLCEDNDGKKVEIEIRIVGKNAQLRIMDTPTLSSGARLRTKAETLAGVFQNKLELLDKQVLKDAGAQTSISFRVDGKDVYGTARLAAKVETGEGVEILSSCAVISENRTTL